MLAFMAGDRALASAHCDAYLMTFRPALSSVCAPKPACSHSGQADALKPSFFIPGSAEGIQLEAQVQGLSRAGR